MMKPVIHLIVALVFWGTAAQAAPKEIFLAAAEWPPYVGEDIRDYGFVSDIIGQAFKRVGYRVRYTFLPPKRVLKEVNAGAFDAGYPAYYSKERARNFLYSLPVAEGEMGFFKRKKMPISFRTLKDLAPYKIGVCLGFSYPSEFEAASFLEKEVAQNETLNLRKLIQGRIDLFITDRAAALAAINRSIPEGADTLEFMAPPLEARKLYLIFEKNKRNEQKRNDFNRGLQMIMADGTVQKIMKKHGIIQ